VVEQDVALDPRDVGVFGAQGIVFELYGVADLIKQFLGTSARVLPKAISIPAVQLYNVLGLTQVLTLRVLSRFGKLVRQSGFQPNTPEQGGDVEECPPSIPIRGLGRRMST
jgi:hypothetical protein